MLPTSYGNDADFTIVCEGHEFRVNKAKVCAASRTMRRELEHPMLESKTDHIVNKEFDASKIERMLDFVYSGDYCLADECEVVIEHEESSNDDEQRVDDMAEKMHALSMQGVIEETVTGALTDEAVRDSAADTDQTTHNSEGACTVNTPDEKSLHGPVQREAEMESAAVSNAEHITISGVNAKLICHTRMYAIGDYYEVHGLRYFAQKAFQAEPGWDARDTAAVIREVNERCDSGDRSLRDLVSVRAQEHHAELLNDEPTIDTLLADPSLHDFVADLMRWLAKALRMREEDRKDFDEVVNQQC